MKKKEKLLWESDSLKILMQEEVEGERGNREREKVEWEKQQQQCKRGVNRAQGLR